MEMMSKITVDHSSREACVYVRQSSLRQVRRNTASTQVQYDLTERAKFLGWREEQIRVCDTDLGVTGAVADQRSGFDDLVRDVGLGKVGVILAFDVTRLARNSIDWLRLFNMCGVCNTLLSDLDGIYDMADYNDRLLVGLKGIMSEAEHHFIRSRLQAAIDKLAEEGKLRKRLPVGYEHQGTQIQKSSNEAIRNVIDTVFETFEAVGSANQVANVLRDRGLLLPTLQATGTLQWRQAVGHAVLGILHNPTYAGAYTHGRIQFTQVINDEGQMRQRSRRRPQDEWKVLIKDHHPGYITWAQYERIEQRIRDNVPKALRAGEGTSVLREGKGLLQGLLRCGVCGRKMRTSYSGSKGDNHQVTVQYLCNGGSGYLSERPKCQSIGGVRITDAVVGALLEAIQPAALEVTHKALERLDQDHDGVEVHLKRIRSLHHGVTAVARELL